MPCLLPAHKRKYKQWTLKKAFAIEVCESVCGFCGKHYKGGVTNLRKHAVRHAGVRLIAGGSGGRPRVSIPTTYDSEEEEEEEESDEDEEDEDEDEEDESEEEEEEEVEEQVENENEDKDNNREEREGGEREENNADEEQDRVQVVQGMEQGGEVVRRVIAHEVEWRVLKWETCRKRGYKCGKKSKNLKCRYRE